LESQKITGHSFDGGGVEAALNCFMNGEIEFHL